MAFGMVKNAEICKKNAEFVKQSLEDIINIDKYALVLSKPRMVKNYMGYKIVSIKFPESRIFDLLLSTENLLLILPNFTASQLV